MESATPCLLSFRHRRVYGARFWRSAGFHWTSPPSLVWSRPDLRVDCWVSIETLLLSSPLSSDLQSQTNSNKTESTSSTNGLILLALVSGFWPPASSLTPLPCLHQSEQLLLLLERFALFLQENSTSTKPSLPHHWLLKREVWILVQVVCMIYIQTHHPIRN